VAVASGALTMTYWWLAGDREHALIRTATVLIIACPHALGLAIPLVIAISTSLGARNGLLVKDRLALERARNLEVVIFDKTGTLTRGSPALSGIAAVAGTSENDLLEYAAAVEGDSEHPLAKAILKEARSRNLHALRTTEFEALPGRGAQALVDGKRIVIGSSRLLLEGKLAVPPEIEKKTTTWAADGRTILYVVAEGHLLGALSVEDEIRAESVEPLPSFIGLALGSP